MNHEKCDDHDDCGSLPIIMTKDDPEDDSNVLCPECEASVENWPWPCGLLTCDTCGYEWRCECCLVDCGETANVAAP